MQKIKEEIERQFRRHLQDHCFWKSFAGENPQAFAAVRDTLLAPGKRLRPLLFCAACRDAGHEPFPALAPAALALELAHSFILIHDDIMDRSAERRGMPTLPQQIDSQFAQSPADGFRGSDFAMIAGDLLYTLAVESLLQTDASDRRRVAALQAFMQAALMTGQGALQEMRVAQMPMEAVSAKQIETLYMLKTGHYTFHLPLQLASVFSGAPESLAQLARPAGIAFQLRNDREVLRRWMAGGAVPDDIRDRRRTWPFVATWQAADRAGRAVLETGSPEAMKAVFDAAGAEALLDAEIERLSGEVVSSLEGGDLRTLLGVALKVPADRPPYAAG